MLPQIACRRCEVPARAWQHPWLGPHCPTALPTVQAVDAWLKESAMTMADLAKRQKMADRIAGYSVSLDTAKLDSLQAGSPPLFLSTVSSDW